MKLKFKKGDYIRIKKDNEDNSSILKGYTGEIIEVEDNEFQPYLIYFDTKINGHSRDYQCYWVYENEIEMVKITNWRKRIL